MGSGHSSKKEKNPKKSEQKASLTSPELASLPFPYFPHLQLTSINFLEKNSPVPKLKANGALRVLDNRFTSFSQKRTPEWVCIAPMTQLENFASINSSKPRHWKSRGYPLGMSSSPDFIQHPAPGGLHQVLPAQRRSLWG